MGKVFASGKIALATCDRCFLTYKYLEMRQEWNGLRVCPSCFDDKHPQLTPPKTPVDAEALRHARPEGSDSIGDTDAQDYLDAVDDRS